MLHCFLKQFMDQIFIEEITDRLIDNENNP